MEMWCGLLRELCYGAWVELNVEGATELLEIKCLQDKPHLERRCISVMHVLKEFGSYRIQVEKQTYWGL